MEEGSILRVLYFILNYVKLSNLSSIKSTPALGPTQPSIQWFQLAFSPRIKRPGREAHHSIQS
jgi:hypothetical protein